MKLRIHPLHEVVIDLPDYLFKAYDQDHFLLMLDSYLREKMMDPSWYRINVGDLHDATVLYKRRKKGEDRIEQVRG